MRCMDTITPIEIFRAGRHVDMHGRAFDISRVDLADIASRYDPTKHEAPLVVGHPQTNAPAYGWVKDLRVSGDTLVADAHQVDPAFAEIVNSGRYKKRSASFLLPTASDNPAPGGYYLNHVGFLGAQPPAVKGLRDAQFAAADQCIEFANDRRWGFRDVASVFRRVRDWIIEREGADAADNVIPAWQIDALIEAAQPDSATEAVIPGPVFAAPLSDEVSMSESNTANFAAREQALSKTAADLLAREQLIAQREQQARRDDATAFAAGLAATDVGKLLPGEVVTVTELLLALPKDKPLSFAAADGTTTSIEPAQAFRDFLTALPQRIDYSEKSRSTTGTATASFATPPGDTVDAASLDLHARATAWQQQHPGTPWLAAVKAVAG